MSVQTKSPQPSVGIDPWILVSAGLGLATIGIGIGYIAKYVIDRLRQKKSVNLQRREIHYTEDSVRAKW
jgi:hypothetical protein